MLKINHIYKSFGSNEILHDVSLDVKKGDVYGILGLSGAGKSTLVRCINGLETVDSGEILFSDFVSITKGESGLPGEIKGSIVNKKEIE